MTSYIKIGGWERPLNKADPSWIREKFMAEAEGSSSLCILFRLQAPDIRLTLPTPGCGPSTGGGRPLNEREREVVEIWKRMALHTVDFSVGNIIAFIQRIKKFLT